MTVQPRAEWERKIKVGRSGLAPGCPAHAHSDSVWHIQDFATAQRLLRDLRTRQGGFGVEHADKFPAKMRQPVTWRDGEEHREHRRQTARYFAPRRVDTTYQAMIEWMAQDQCAVLLRNGRADLSELAFSLSVAVVGQVLGLTEGGAGLATRLDRIFKDLDVVPGWANPQAVRRQAAAAYNMGAFYRSDVRPAIAVRRVQRRDDLISHLIDEGCTNGEILGECVTYAGAGMVTTREFITVAAWHLLSDDELRASYSGGDRDNRMTILQEILRLEPVVANLARWTTGPMEFDSPTGPVAVPVGTRLDIDVAAANLDASAVGECPGQLRPGRQMAAGVAEVGLAFGDGPHRCPGAHIAMAETEIFLTKLLALPQVRMIAPPSASLRPEFASYAMSGLQVAVGPTDHQRRTPRTNGRAKIPIAAGSRQRPEGEASDTNEHYIAPSWATQHMFNRVVGQLSRRGISLFGARELAVRGRRSGQWRTTPVGLVELQGRRYILSATGNSQWVRNLRAAGTGELRLGSRAEPFRARELPEQERLPVLRAYLTNRWKSEVERLFDGVGSDASDDELRAIVPKHPVFEILPLT
ncbi:nitroreductase family deazaflavin-dependent oxidoreductase [Micromonospora zingiberis]|uniref:Nitroreductase family deazaflavin-dependent oxidoreductase n=1 Tax=Micromonospora zingiberis TaxID=2053011 RepID=A0A4R0GL37_9ACTN|nr:nitroreductase family deazaflavin-dependent oxidoreductase [Micromonospora zingiberis]TCB97302.1 nitroreductase family deazaflavin-dependent oxidoreductase [Micromonospora zingiberis]